jgi:hypothetical protein
MSGNSSTVLRQSAYAKSKTPSISRQVFAHRLEMKIPCSPVQYEPNQCEDAIECLLTQFSRPC